MTRTPTDGTHDAVPTHPEAVDGDPHTLRWVVPAGMLGMVGPVGECPAPLADLRADGVVRVLVAEPDALRITLAPELNWREEGARVRDALEASLAEAQRLARGGECAFHPEPVPVSITPALGATNSAPLGASWPATKTSAAPAASARPRDILAAAVDQVLGGDVGVYLASHGGRAHVVAVTDNSVELELGGTCASCPARNFTMRNRVEAEIRRRYPSLREVRLR